MKQKYNLHDVLEFYQQNELNEIFSNEPNNKLKIDGKPLIALNKKTKEKSAEINLILDQESKKEKLPDHHNNQESTTISKVKNISSTSQALAELAKKNQTNIMENKLPNIDEKFLSLNQIVENARILANKAKNIAELKEVVANFDGCNLKKMATNTVFADGNPNSKIMVIGEAPGNHEDLSGVPFCGDSGEMLTAMFNAINLTRDKDYYITNVIFWRPPGNRRPTDEELAICRPFVERHLQLFNPKVIILVGATAMNAIIDTSEAISKIRGQFIDFSPQFLENKTKIFTIFHPSFLMRQPAKKRLAWLDMINLQKFIKNNYEE
jgi:uracil-DNA glycosylase family 4